MVTLARIALRLIEDALRWAVLLFRSTDGRRQAAWPVTTSMMAGRPGMDVAV